MQVTSSECNPAPNTGFHLNSKTDCLAMCDAYASSGLGCRFAAWVESASDNCLLYSLDFSTFLGGCRVLGGPPTSTSTTPSGCDVEYPDDNTCDVVRYLSNVITPYSGAHGSYKSKRNYNNCLYYPTFPPKRIFRYAITLSNSIEQTQCSGVDY